MPIAPDRGLEIFETVFVDITDHRIGGNRMPVEVGAGDRDLLPIFREMGLEISLESSPKKISRAESVGREVDHASQVLLDMGLAAGLTYAFYNGTLEEMIMQVPAILRPWG